MVAFPLDRLLRLWSEPLGARAEDAFGELYADPVTVNGTSMPVAGIVARARTMQATYADRRMDVLDLVETPERVVVAFRMSGRHIGPLETPLGTVPPTGRFVEMRTIDVLALSGGRVSSIWVVADELGMLTQLGAVRVDPTYED